MSSTDVIEEDGLYTDEDGNQFQYKKGTVLPPGTKEGLTRSGDYPEPEENGEAEMAATEPTPEEKQAQADAKAAPPASTKQAPAPENKSSH